MFVRLARRLAGLAGQALGACVFLGACVCLSGCVVNGAGSYLDGDPVLFAAEVQPVIARECAFEGCHGREGMPLTLYAPNFLRLRDPEGDVDTSNAPLDELELSETELDHNRRAIAARVSATDPDGLGLIQRLLPPEEGGVPHAGVVVYSSREHLDIVALQRFLSTVDVD